MTSPDDEPLSHDTHTLTQAFYLIGSLDVRPSNLACWTSLLLTTKLIISFLENVSIWNCLSKALKKVGWTEIFRVGSGLDCRTTDLARIDAYTLNSADAQKSAGRCIPFMELSMRLIKSFQKGLSKDICNNSTTSSNTQIRCTTWLDWRGFGGFGPCDMEADGEIQLYSWESEYSSIWNQIWLYSQSSFYHWLYHN